jgi:hypothetical protein
MTKQGMLLVQVQSSQEGCFAKGRVSFWFSWSSSIIIVFLNFVHTNQIDNHMFNCFFVFSFITLDLYACFN